MKPICVSLSVWDARFYSFPLCIAHAQVTLFVCIIYRHATLAADGVASTLEHPILIKDFVFGVSDDHKHNARVRHVTPGNVGIMF